MKGLAILTEVPEISQFAYYIANTSGIGNMNDEYCYDVATTWVSRESSLPLAEEAAQSMMVQRIYAVLESKSYTIATLGGAREEDAVEDDKKGESPALSGERKRAAAVPEEKGFIAWLCELLSWD